jgi:hypothetical protein
MSLAILFWFYKEPEICENRLQLLKKHNPDLKIFGFFGGEESEAPLFKEKLNKYLDDFYVCPEKDSDIKWIHGDLMILDWYDQRGRNLEWDSIVVAQWDMLVFDSFKNQLPGIQKDQIFFSGLRKLDPELENRWHWTKPDGEERQDFLNFREYVKNKYGYTAVLPCCLFILEIIPRLFFDKYLSVENKKVGMLEYKTPTYAKIFGVPFYERDLGVQWAVGEETPMNAEPEEIKTEYIERELSKPNGWRIFHPYFKIWKL